MNYFSRWFKSTPFSLIFLLAVILIVFAISCAVDSEETAEKIEQSDIDFESLDDPTLNMDFAIDDSDMPVVANRIRTAVPLPDQFAKANDQFQINTHFTDDQKWPRPAMNASGNIAVFWHSNLQDTDQYGIYGQMLTAPDTFVGGEFRANSTVAGSQTGAYVAMDDSGNFVAIWTSNPQDGDDAGIFGQRYDSTGAPQGSEFPVNTTTVYVQTNCGVAMDSAGNFVVVWQSNAPLGVDYEILAREYNAAGVAQTGEIPVNTTTTDHQAHPNVAMNGSGDYVVVWDSDTASNGTDIHGQRFQYGAGAVGTEFTINTSLANDQTWPRVAINSAGNYAVGWASFNAGGTDSEIVGRTYDFAHTTISSEIPVNSVTDYLQGSVTVGIDDGDRIMFAWQSQDPVLTRYHIKRRIFSLNGTALSTETHVNQNLLKNQWGPYLAMQPNGETIITWSLKDVDTSGYGCFGRYYECLLDYDCDDGVYCNGAESCNDGECTAGTPVSCPDNNVFCDGTEFCDEINDQCTHTGDPCNDDGLWCNGTESCDEVNDQCVHSHSPATRCPDDGLWCNGNETCIEASDTCGHSGTPCPDDGLWCNGTESCDEVVDVCNHSGDPCTDDGLWCNGTESCDEPSDTCVHSHTPATRCPDDGLFCTGVESCDEAQDLCAASGNPCPDDGEFCNGDETCDEGTDTCGHENAPCGDDGLFCNGDETCDEAADTCGHSGDPCDDGEFCNGDEQCDEDYDSCSDGQAPCEDDGIFCNGLESCNETADECVHSGDPCDDGEYCNGVETCNEDTSDCTDAAQGPCTDDGLFCNGDESCDEENDQCTSSGDPCEDGQTCDEQTDLCTEGSGDDDDDDDAAPSDDDDDSGGGCCG